jgi:hypothetical protein
MHRRLAGLGFALALVLGATQLRAQEITVGIKGGINIADLEIDDPSGGEETDTRTVFGVGAYAEFGIGDVFAIQPEVLYAPKGATDQGEVAEPEEAVELTFKLNYIEVPLLLKARIPVKNSAVTPSLYVGPVVAFETKCEVEATNASLSVSASCDTIGEFGEENIETKSVDFGIALGAGLAIPVGPVVLVGDVRYTLGLTDINDTAALDEVNIKNRVWSFSVGAGMPIGS